MKVKAAKTVILADGVFPSHAVPVGALRGAERIVCCDGAAEKLAAAGMEPAWVVGDLDSLPETARGRLAGRLVEVAEQDSNDLTKAVRFCLGRGWRRLAVVGATGLREDHTLANVSLLVDYAREAKAVTMLTDCGWFTPVLESTEFASFAGQQVSVFSFEPGVRVYAEGLRFPLDGVPFTRWWQATLNEACGEGFRLVFEGGPLLVYQTYAEEAGDGG